MVTVVKRIDSETDAIISHLKHPHIHLPNTSGAVMQRAILRRNWQEKP
jgi:hypothetical protein